MNIDELKNKLEEDLSKYDVNTAHISIVVEEILLLYEQDLDLVKCNVKKSKKELYIELIIPGENKTLRQLEENNNIYLLDTTVSKTDCIISHDYKDGNNIINISLKRYYTLLNNMKFALSYLRGKTKALIIAGIFNLVAICINLVIPYFTGRLITSYTENIFAQIAVSVSMLFACRIAYTIFIGISGIYYNRVFNDLFGNLQSELVLKLLDIADGKLEAYGSGQFIKRIDDDAIEISNDVSSFFNIISNAFYYIGVLIASLTYDKIVFFAELLTFLGLYYLEVKRIKRLDINKRKLIKINEERSEKILEVISGASEIKAMNAKQYFVDKIKTSAKDVANLSFETHADNSKSSSLNTIYTHTCYFLIMMYLGYALSKGTLSVPEALVLYNYFTIISMPLVALVQRFLNFKKNFSISCERAYDLLHGNEFTKEKSGNIDLKEVKGDIEFKNVSFTYTNNKRKTKVLNNISFKIDAGNTVTIVGVSGSGKTTILKLIDGQRDPSIGSVTIDGYDVMKINKDSLRKNMSIISQSPYIFNTTIRENLLMAKPDATQAELEEACEKACILDDILQTEYGFDTMMNEKGVRFSGGQKQRLAIARALLRKTKILILDESTSAVDNIAQAKIMNSIKNLKNECTVIIVAHRLSTIINSNKILFLSKGKIIAQGTHKNLLTNCPEYNELYLAENQDKKNN